MCSCLWLKCQFMVCVVGPGFITKSPSNWIYCPVNYHMGTLSDDERIYSKLLSSTWSYHQNSTYTNFDNVVVTDKIPATWPGEVVDVGKYPHLSGLSLVTGVKAEVITGNNNPQFTLPLEMRCNCKCSKDPYAVRTRFVWTSYVHTRWR